MLSVVKITDGVYFLKQNHAIHPLSTSNGYLIAPSQIQSASSTEFSESLLLDVNLEEEGWLALKKFCIEQCIPLPTKLIMTHCHLDHSSHVHQFVDIFTGHVYAPEPEVKVILEHDGFFNVYQIQEMQEIPSLRDSYRHLKYEILQFGIIPERKITTFAPGKIFDYSTIQIETIPLIAHSPGHVGSIITIANGLKIFHNSCLGLDHSRIKKNGEIQDGFGPWYGFKHSIISEYLKDIDKSEAIFEKCDILTSSHGLIFTKKHNSAEIIQGERLFIKDLPATDDIESPFNYMKRKIQEKGREIEDVLLELDIKKDDVHSILESSNILDKLSEMDLFFSRDRIPPKQIAAYKFWERYLIINQLKHLAEI